MAKNKKAIFTPPFLNMQRFFGTERVGFICQISEDALKVIKYISKKHNKTEFVGLEVETLLPGIDDKKLSERFNQVFKRLEYNHNPIIISLPRSYVTCRYLKIPSQVPTEIERIINLQASSYLPYSPSELIIGYQIISTDKDGYAYINLVIVYKDVIERYLKAFKGLKTVKPTVGLSSYGLCNLYNYIKTQEPHPVMLVDIDSQQIELAIIFRRKLLFSRSFKLNRGQTNWENLFIEEINKTRDAYLKEVSMPEPVKIIVLGEERAAQELARALNKQTVLAIETLSYDQSFNLSQELVNSITTCGRSFTSLIGLGLERIPESLNLLPKEIKAEVAKASLRKERLKLILVISGIILIWGLGIAKNLDNKTRYLKQLKTELNKISKEARPLEEIEKRLKFIEAHAQKEISSLDILYELHQTMPTQINLANFIYEEDKEVTLRGQAQELDAIFIFVGQLEKSVIFKNFNIKVKYATKRKTAAGEIVDFEITCLKK